MKNTKWIDTRKKLPPTKKIVLGWFSEYLSFSVLVYYENNTWYEQTGTITNCIRYWQYLPEKPDSKNIEE